MIQARATLASKKILTENKYHNIFMELLHFIIKYQNKIESISKFIFYHKFPNAHLLSFLSLTKDTHSILSLHLHRTLIAPIKCQPRYKSIDDRHKTTTGAFPKDSHYDNFSLQHAQNHLNKLKT